MKGKWLGFFLLTALLLGAVCAWQFRQLRAARLHAALARQMQDTERLARLALEERLQESERGRARLEREVQEFTVVTAMLRASEARQASNAIALAQQVRAGTAEAAPTDVDAGKGGVFGKGMGEMLAKMMKDPGMREMIRGQQKAAFNLMYSDVFKELNLPPGQKEKLMELLLDNQMKNLEVAQGLFGKDAGDGASSAKAINEQKKENDARIRELLGAEKYTQYEDYQKNLSERMQLSQLRNHLEAQNLRLQADQSAQLLRIMNEEKNRVPPVIPTGGGGQVPGDLKNFLTAEKLDQQLDWMENYARRVKGRAGEVLTPEQLEKFIEFQEQQASMQRLSLKMARDIFGGDQGVPGSAPPAAK